MQAVDMLVPTVGVVMACAALAVSRATFYRRRQPSRPTTPRPAPPRALSAEESANVLELLNSERFADKAPRQAYAELLDEGVYHCSPRTMYRILNANQQVRERRDQLRHPSYVKPELLATAPNQVWSWDITKLLGPQKWTYYYLYVVLDIFSRYVVGWMVATKESAALAQRLIADSCAKQSVVPGQLTIHADRGAPMTAKSTALLMADLGVTKTHSRPHVSDDNPFSEAHFKTIKYRPELPDRFGSLEDARAVVGPLMRWYNDEHHHSALALLTPHQVHHGLAYQVIAQRQRVLDAARDAHPERFVRGPPRHPAPPREAWINPPSKPTASPENSAH